MSHKVTPKAYETRLGNSSAKNLLFCLADAANPEGYGWPSVETLAEATELSLRQVLRLIQVFQEIKLVEKIKTGKSEKFKYAFQLNLALLGTDLRGLFGQAFQKAQGKDKDVSATSSVSETHRKNVSETEKHDAETQKSVSETEPPHPHKGVTAKEPLGTAKSSSPAAQSKRANKKSPDLRHTPFREVLSRYWISKNPLVPEMPWGKAEAGALGTVLSNNPTLTVEQFTHLLSNRWKSEENHSEHPHKWLHGVLKYASGPLDRYGKPLGTNGGNRNVRGTTKAERTIDATRQAIEHFENRARAGRDGSSEERGVESPGADDVRGKVIDATL